MTRPPARSTIGVQKRPGSLVVFGISRAVDGSTHINDRVRLLPPDATHAQLGLALLDAAASSQDGVPLPDQQVPDPVQSALGLTSIEEYLQNARYVSVDWDPDGESVEIRSLQNTGSTFELTQESPRFRCSTLTPEGLGDAIWRVLRSPGPPPRAALPDDFRGVGVQTRPKSVVVFGMSRIVGSTDSCENSWLRILPPDVDEVELGQAVLDASDSSEVGVPPPPPRGPNPVQEALGLKTNAAYMRNTRYVHMEWTPDGVAVELSPWPNVGPCFEESRKIPPFRSDDLTPAGLGDAVRRGFEMLGQPRPGGPSSATPTSSGDGVPFGYKTGWLAFESVTPDQVTAILGVRNVQQATWDEAITASYEQPDAVAITPPIESKGRSWVLATGVALIEPTPMPDLASLSNATGGEVQFFATHRVSETHESARAVAGRLVRDFQWSGDQGDVGRWSGRPDAAEQALGLPEIEDADDDAHEQILDAVFDADIDEDSVMTLAGAWSVNPQTLDEVPIAGGPIIGRIGPSAA